jgi:hypothetical protein
VAAAALPAIAFRTWGGLGADQVAGVMEVVLIVAVVPVLLMLMVRWSAAAQPL